MPDLSRLTATPGHNAKMSMIFRDAATSLQDSRLPLYQPSSNTKRFRLPLSQARSVQIGSTCQNDTMVSSGWGSPSKIGQCLGESCESDRASSEVSRHRTSGAGPHKPTPTPLTKIDHPTLGISTGQCLNADTGVDSMCIDDTLRANSAFLSSQIEEEAKEPISSGFETRIAPTPNLAEKPEDVEYPTLGNWRSLRSSSNASCLGSDSEDLHSTHGVPFILPFPNPNTEEAPRSHIDTWLNGVVEATTFGLSSSLKKSYGTEDLIMNDAPPRSISPRVSSPIRPRESPSKSKSKQDLQSPSVASSDKENISPSKCSSSPTRPPAQYLQAWTPSRVYPNNTQSVLQHTKALHFAHPLTPQGSLSLPPKRKRARVDRIDSSKEEKEIPTPRRDFAIHEDQLAEALAQLSPDVERQRKGRGPKKERCMSYWDEDILHLGSQCIPMDVDGHGGRTEKGTQVFGESK